MDFSNLKTPSFEKSHHFLATAIEGLGIACEDSKRCESEASDGLIIHLVHTPSRFIGGALKTRGHWAGVAVSLILFLGWKVRRLRGRVGNVDLMVLLWSLHIRY